ncbi:MAG: hypothetical protein AUK48_00625 [Oscillatoriales cyanobacterium CG2_30_44_21]|nr:MAG: hypothetical protein AUK48_00625 [Oscillatoriales cyanobacterium CG2_30_44_21]
MSSVYLNAREIFESAAEPRFQKFLKASSPNKRLAEQSAANRLLIVRNCYETVYPRNQLSP